MPFASGTPPAAYHLYCCQADKEVFAMAPPDVVDQTATAVISIIKAVHGMKMFGTTDYVVPDGAVRKFFGRFLCTPYQKIRRVRFLEGPEVRYLEEGNYVWRTYGAGGVIIGAPTTFVPVQFPWEHTKLTREEALDQLLAEEPVEELCPLEAPGDISIDHSSVDFQQVCDALFESSDREPFWLDESTETDVAGGFNHIKNGKLRSCEELSHVTNILAGTSWLETLPAPPNRTTETRSPWLQVS